LETKISVTRAIRVTFKDWLTAGILFGRKAA